MPIVEVTMFEGRSEEVKARLAREIAVVVGEATKNSVSDVHVLITDKSRENWGRGVELASRRAPQSDRKIDLPEYASISRIKYRPETEADYLRLRAEVINPGMATCPGFIDTLLVRPEDKEDEYVLVIRWMSKQDAENYHKSPLHEELRVKAMELLPQALETYGSEIVHL